MKDVISVEKAPERIEEKRSERLQTAVHLHKLKKTPRHHRTHYELRKQARERAWERAQAKQGRRRVSISNQDQPEDEERPEPTRRKQLRSVVVID
jgi:hypothetical protein